MSCKNDLAAAKSRKQPCLPGTSSSRRAGPSSWTRPSTSTSLSSHTRNSQATDTDHLDSPDEISLDSDLDQRTASSATLFSHRASSSLSTTSRLASSECDLSVRLSESRQSRFLYPLHEPGQRTAHATQRLRARTAAVIMSMPATCEDVIDSDEDESYKAARVPQTAQVSKLRRVRGIRNLRRAFRDADPDPVIFAPIPLGVSQASYELGILSPSTPPLSPLSPRSSLFTLVDTGNSLAQSYGDIKTLCDSSMSISSRIASKVYSTLSSRRTSQTYTDTTSPQLTLPTGKYHNLSVVRSSRRHVSLNLDACPTPSRPDGDTIWSCAKISQSAVKRAARRGHAPRRVFSNPIAVLSSS